MLGPIVTLPAMLEAREARARRQSELLAKYRQPLVCFTMNIAGPVKQTPLIRRGFDLGCRYLTEQFFSSGITLLYTEVHRADTGDTAFFVPKANPGRIQQLTAEIEDGSDIGRLFDMDVLTSEGMHVGREALGLPERKCLICDQNAKACARSRTHSVEELQAHTVALLKRAFMAKDAQFAAQTACRALLYEVCTSPKPGLVDRFHTGSHADMDCFTFMDSASAIWPYFERCARIGMETSALTPEETFRRLRWQGKHAESEMLLATNGVNTHKGAIFSLGILCGALGRLEREWWRDESRILCECAAMTRGIVARELQNPSTQTPATAGTKLYAACGSTGIRGEAEAGFPTVQNVGLPILEQGLARGLTLNDAGCAALLHMLTVAEDSNLAHRGGREGQKRAVEAVRELLSQNPFPGGTQIREIDAMFVRENLSPGGTADLLSVTCFLHFLKTAR